MPKQHDSKADPTLSMVYQIRINGHLGHQWKDWFGGLAISLDGNGDTLITGSVLDQAALHGILKKVRDLGMPLVSVLRIKPNQTDVSDVKTLDECPHYK